VEKGLAAEPDKLAAWSPSVTEKRVAALLGKRRREDDVLFKEGAIGVAYGLAWTETGGTLLPVEALSYAGTEGLILTGNLGDVMKESARAALSFIRSKAADLGLSESDFHKRVLHIHVPEGAIPKDGPSAGVTLVASLVSALSGRPLAPGLAMTGEITLTGRVLPVGGVKEKVLAARRNSIGRVILPEGNRKDLDELPAEIRDSTEFLFVASAEEALAILLPPKSASKRSAKVPARARKTPRI